MENIFRAAILEGKAEPKSTADSKKEWFPDTPTNTPAVQAQATDMTFFIHRQAESGIRSGWTTSTRQLARGSRR